MDGFDVSFLQEGLLFFLVLVSSLCVHEWAHAWTADRLGDPTPHNEGRVTLNPLPHIDLLGTIIFPLFCIFMLKGGFFFGWAKPAPVDARHFKHPGRGDVITTVAGPLSNLAVAALAAVVGGLCYRFWPHDLGLPRERVAYLVGLIIRVNAWLFVFNMLPLPPLDGGRILRYVINMSWETFARISQWSMLIILGAIYLVPGFSAVLSRLIQLTEIPALLVFALSAGG